MSAKSFNCGPPGHLKKQCKLFLQQMNIQNQWAPGLNPKGKKEKHLAKKCQSKYAKKGQCIA